MSNSRMLMLTATTYSPGCAVQKYSRLHGLSPRGWRGGKNGNYFSVVDIHGHLWVITGTRSFPIRHHLPPPGIGGPIRHINITYPAWKTCIFKQINCGNGRNT